ncbi:copper-binding protein [Yersinia massiliensis]|uniref:copper-binding protein n=1 Tax=Yersinia massiliensis TaxID=419257 RepID=UPI00119E7D69|nr:copper-binding protein [Yersinia massiliensis]MCB5309701.1 copper-binding protein [Yersinia massiliensis]
MRTLSRAVSATAGVLFSTATLFSIITFFSAITLFPTSLSAATSTMADTMPMSHDHGAMMADAATSDAGIYHSRGQIKAWNATSVSIAHTTIAALNWPPMTMTFDLPDGLMATPLPVGASVTFSFIQTRQGYQLTAISAQQP